MSLPDRTPKEIRDEVGNTEATRGNIVHVSKSSSDNESEGQLVEDVSRIQSAVKLFDAAITYKTNDLALSPDIGNHLIRANQAVSIAPFDISQWDFVEANYFTNYKTRLDFHVDSSQVTGTHEKFEVKVAGTFTELIGKSETAIKGDDIIFAQNEKLLKFDIDDYDDATGVLHATILLDINDTTDVQFQLYIGNPDALPFKDPVGVWTERYIARYALQDDPTVTTIQKDSTGNFDGVTPTDLNIGITNIVGNGVDNIITVTLGDTTGLFEGRSIKIQGTTNFELDDAIILPGLTSTTFTYDLGSIGSATPESVGGVETRNQPEQVSGSDFNQKFALEFVATSTTSFPKYVTLPTSLSKEIKNKTALNLMALMKRDDGGAPFETFGTLVAKQMDDTSPGSLDWGLTRRSNVANNMRMVINDSSAFQGNVNDATVYVLSGNYDGANINSWRDTTEGSDTAETDAILDTTPTLNPRIGAANVTDESNQAKFQGLIGEIRIAITSLSDDYITTRADNLLSSSLVILDDDRPNAVGTRGVSEFPLDELANVTVTNLEHQNIVSYDVFTRRWINIPIDADKVIRARSMKDLTEKFGETLIIPANELWAVYFDEPFVLTQGFKKSTGAGIILTTSAQNITTTFTPDVAGEALIDSTGSGVSAGSSILGAVRITSTDDTCPVFDGKGSGAGSRLSIEPVCTLSNFNRLGFANEYGAVNLTTFVIFNFKEGIRIRDTPAVGISNFNDVSTLGAITGRHLVRLQDPNVPMSVFVDGIATTTKAGEFVFDIESVQDTSRYVIRDVFLGGSDEGSDKRLFKPRIADQAVTSVSDSGSTIAEFNHSGSSPLEGELVDLFGFTTESYNAVLRKVTLSSSSFFETGAVFDVDDTGTFRVLVDQTHPRVEAKDNSNYRDSMTIGGWFHNTNVASTTILDGTFGPLNLSTDDGVIIFAENERFIIIDKDTGSIKYTGVKPKTVTLITVLSLQKSGSSGNYNLRYAVDKDVGEIETADVVLAGVSYSNGESVGLTGQISGATGATATVSETTGEITALTIVDGASGYIEDEILEVTGGSGSGATGRANLLLAFVALPTPMERSQEISSTNRDTTLNQEVVLNENETIRVEIEGNGTTDSVEAVFVSHDIKG